LAGQSKFFHGIAAPGAVGEEAATDGTSGGAALTGDDVVATVATGTAAAAGGMARGGDSKAQALRSPAIGPSVKGAGGRATRPSAASGSVPVDGNGGGAPSIHANFVRSCH
jgi:hypothetical protein